MSGHVTVSQRAVRAPGSLLDSSRQPPVDRAGHVTTSSPTVSAERYHHLCHPGEHLAASPTASQTVSTEGAKFSLQR